MADVHRVGFIGFGFIGWLRAHIASIAHFLEAVRGGGPGDPGLAQGVYVQRPILLPSPAGGFSMYRGVCLHRSSGRRLEGR